MAEARGACKIMRFPDRRFTCSAAGRGNVTAPNNSANGTERTTANESVSRRAK